MVDKLKENMKQLRLPTFFPKADHLSSDDEDGDPIRQKSEDRGATDLLEACGYEVVPEVFEEAGGSWKPIEKVTN